MLLPVLAAALVLLALVLSHYHVPVRHRWRRRQARAMALQLGGPDRLKPRRLLYARLRAMDPLAFEELLLESFERRGLKIVRNRRYTDDGGIDGQVTINGMKWLTQAKRYASATGPEHVLAFDTLCEARRCRGLFIHTGRTGAQSRGLARSSGRVEIMSGRRLLALVTGGPVAILDGPNHPLPGAGASRATLRRVV